MIETRRLVLRAPRWQDADAIYRRYASDPDVCRYLAFPQHRTVDDARAFVAFSKEEWSKWPAGPFLLFDASGKLVGSTGLSFESATRASTGYVIAQDSWGKGYATEAVAAMVRLAATLGVESLYAFVHVDHLSSQRVLLKAGFSDAGIRERYFEFPNLLPGVKLDVRCFSRKPGAD